MKRDEMYDEDYDNLYDHIMEVLRAIKWPHSLTSYRERLDQITGPLMMLCNEDRTKIAKERFEQLLTLGNGLEDFEKFIEQRDAKYKPKLKTVGS